MAGDVPDAQFTAVPSGEHGDDGIRKVNRPIFVTYTCRHSASRR